jgi:putative membrane protein
MSTRLIMQTAASTLLLGFAFAACAQSGSRDAPLVANAADSMFMAHASADGMAEIHMGQMALEKSSDAKVKQLAQRIVDDHTDANGKLRALAQTKQVTLPTAPTAEAQHSADAMTDLDTKKFDKEWAAAMVKDHQKAVTLFSTEIRKTQDPEIRTFAEKTLPTLKTHLKLAQQLRGQLDMPGARDEAMDHSVPMDGSFASTRPATAATARVPAAPAPLPAPTDGSQ